jgi:hypothetical protein
MGTYQRKQSASFIAFWYNVTVMKYEAVTSTSYCVHCSLEPYHLLRDDPPDHVSNDSKAHGKMNQTLKSLQDVAQAAPPPRLLLPS